MKTLIINGSPRTNGDTACTLLNHMNCHDIHPAVFSHGTNNRLALEDHLCLNGVKDIIAALNHRKRENKHEY